MRLRAHKILISSGAVADLRAAVKANERQRVAWLGYLSSVSPELWRRHLSGKQARAERIPPKIREQVRGSGPCAYCGDPDPGEVDHVIPVAQGGTCNPRNLVPACGQCNRAKGGRTPEQWAAGAPLHPNAAARRKTASAA
jgi:5-methylcytosine-specific restriction endonuclease McrA